MGEKALPNTPTHTIPITKQLFDAHFDRRETKCGDEHCYVYTTKFLLRPDDLVAEFGRFYQQRNTRTVVANMRFHVIAPLNEHANELTETLRAIGLRAGWRLVSYGPAHRPSGASVRGGGPSSLEFIRHFDAVFAL